jgi:CheY-like chemotaxis protein
MIAMTRTLRIAVADDEPDVRDYFRRILPRLGHKVIAAAANGRELVDLCNKLKPDLIIADVRMPDMDGDDAIQAICSVHPTPFILISAYSKPASMPDGLEAIDYAYLTKPVKREDLEQAIEKVCSAAGQE